jgi:hypothetical protein
LSFLGGLTIDGDTTVTDHKLLLAMLFAMGAARAERIAIFPQV